MEKKVKVTKTMILNAIDTLIAADAKVEFDEVTVTGKDIKEYVNKTLDQIVNKAEKAKVRAAEKRAEGDVLRATVADVLTDEYQTIAEITEKINAVDPEITRAKVTARLTALVKENLAHKTLVKLEDGRKVNAYADGPAPLEADE